MVITDRSTPVPKKSPRRMMRIKSRPHGLPSPALCCACGLCIMLAGLNITLVGAFAFSTLVPSANPPIIIGPILLLVALSFFGACCVCSRLPPPTAPRRSKVGGRGTGLMGRGGLAGAAFEIETSEHTLQDTTAVQLSPTSSPGSSQASAQKERLLSRPYQDLASSSPWRPTALLLFPPPQSTRPPRQQEERGGEAQPAT
ncbi:LOW QUALITY PROTEIN: transmembrane protein 275-like [Notolabrus celidotus]|uniref:LOW QUALITY PROTEIN: transmembrane protein 275-like n=1 Tax=Notolabrus celidotus TaxID=1203425 RepID=UPI00148FD6C8|nr:LOW QUALITY PROTEIN: transmembrane protein 275-like [Notolabrus celidotus]